MSVGGSGSTSGIGERASILRAAPILRVPDSSSSSSSSSPVKPIVLDKAAAAARFSSLQGVALVTKSLNFLKLSLQPLLF